MVLKNIKIRSLLDLTIAHEHLDKLNNGGS
jgi:hypothetical protein